MALGLHVCRCRGRSMLAFLLDMQCNLADRHTEKQELGWMVMVTLFPPSGWQTVSSYSQVSAEDTAVSVSSLAHKTRGL